METRLGTSTFRRDSERNTRVYSFLKSCKLLRTPKVIVANKVAAELSFFGWFLGAGISNKETQDRVLRPCGANACIGERRRLVSDQRHCSSLHLPPYGLRSTALDIFVIPVGQRPGGGILVLVSAAASPVPIIGIHRSTALEVLRKRDSENNNRVYSFLKSCKLLRTPKGIVANIAAAELSYFECFLWAEISNKVTTQDRVLRLEFGYLLI